MSIWEHILHLQVCLAAGFVVLLVLALGYLLFTFLAHMGDEDKNN